ncbi:MAG TPA: GIDE domain-containing protein [Candidatus Thermoplasmatota archaeon]|nr:GIDE domain-containing protein [Candidatus Thermoplasmatota archaeon]
MNAVGLILLVAGAALFGGAWWAYGRRRAIADTPTSNVRSMAIGPVELQGTAAAAPGRELLRAPFTDEPCVYWEYKVEEQRTRHTKNGTQTYWATVESGRSKAPIGLRDETGVATIDPEGADMPGPMVAQFGSGFQRDPTPRIQEFLLKKDIRFEGLFGLNKRMRFTENRLPEGATLYVLGNATRREDAGAEAAVGNAALVVQRHGPGAFLVSTSSEKALLRNWTIGFWALLLSGIAAAAAGASVLGAP